MYKNNWEKVVQNCTRTICNILPYNSKNVNINDVKKWLM